MGRIIVIEDNPVFRDHVCGMLEKAGYETRTAYDCAGARRLLAELDEEDIILSDLRLPDGECTEVLERMREAGIRNPFVIMTDYAQVASAVSSMRLGAEDYIPKTLLQEKLLPRIRELVRKTERRHTMPILERRSAAFRTIDRRISLVAPTDIGVLILGENGTGKEHIAEKIHAQSTRQKGPFVAIDCGMLTRELAAANDMTCDVYDVLIDTQRELGALLEDSPLENHLHPMPEVMDDTVALVDRRQELAVNGLTGVPTGLQRLNEMTGGWQPGNLIFTAARPADGKTALDLFFARQAAMAGVPVVFFTLEMTASELGERMVLAESSADPLRIRQGRLSPEEVEDVHRTAERMSALPVHVDDTPYINVDQLCVIAKSLRAKGLLGLLIVDYLQLLATVNPGRTREQEVAECSRKLKGLARSLGCPVIVSSQLNRQAEDRAGSPELRHLRESGAIEQDADLVILLHRPERYHIRVDPDTGWSTRGMGIATVAKHRNGATGKVYYGYNPSMTKIGEFAGTPVAAPANNLKRKNDEGKSSDLFGGSAG